MIRVKGNESQKRTRREARTRIIRMEFWTYLNSLILLPAQVVRGARQRVFRLLDLSYFCGPAHHDARSYPRSIAVLTFAPGSKPKSGCFGTAQASN